MLNKKSEDNPNKTSEMDVEKLIAKIIQKFVGIVEESLNALSVQI